MWKERGLNSFRRLWCGFFLWLVLSICASWGEVTVAGDAGRLFNERVWPLLEGKCLQCHGVEKQKGGLRLDSREGLMRGG